jgi:hypothetical protein
MLEWFSKLPESTVWVLPALGGIALSALWGYWHYNHETRKSELKAQVDREALALKRDMIERGMSADDIERVLRASGEGDIPSGAGRVT